jgi:hypothetical protein
VSDDRTKAQKSLTTIGQAFELPDDSKLNKDDYEIASMAWQEGLSVNTIIDRLSERRGERKQHDAAAITRVRRSLQKAVRWGVLEFHPPRHQQLESRLREIYPSLDSVHVEVDRTATLLRAAELILDQLEEFLRGEARTFVCANAGGRTIADMVALMPRLAPIPLKAKDKRIVFVSLNAAEEQVAFGHCSNYLCVRMSEIFSAEHMAVVRPSDPSRRSIYKEATARADLIVSAAGGTDGFLASWLGERGETLPDEVVGDIGFHPLDQYGKPARLDARATELLENELQRSPDWDTLVQLFSKKKLLLILTGDKFGISRALFRAALPRRCVIDSYLAAQLCREGTNARSEAFAESRAGAQQ